MQAPHPGGEPERPSEERRRPRHGRLDKALDETWFASDAPSWLPVTGVRVPKGDQEA